MRQIYNADSPSFWEAVEEEEEKEEEQGGGRGTLPKLACPNLPPIGVRCGVVTPEGGTAATIKENLKDNNCLSACSFAYRLRLTNLLPSRLAIAHLSLRSERKVTRRGFICRAGTVTCILMTKF